MSFASVINIEDVMSAKDKAGRKFRSAKAKTQSRFDSVKSKVTDSKPYTAFIKFCDNEKVVKYSTAAIGIETVCGLIGAIASATAMFALGHILIGCWFLIAWLLGLITRFIVARSAIVH